MYVISNGHPFTLDTVEFVILVQLAHVPLIVPFVLVFEQMADWLLIEVSVLLGYSNT